MPPLFRWRKRQEPDEEPPVPLAPGTFRLLPLRAPLPRALPPPPVVTSMDPTPRVTTVYHTPIAPTSAMETPLYPTRVEGRGFVQTIELMDALEVSVTVGYLILGLFLVAYVSLVAFFGNGAGKKTKEKNNGKKDGKHKQTAKEKLQCWCQWQNELWDYYANIVGRKLFGFGNVSSDESIPWVKDTEV